MRTKIDKNDYNIISNNKTQYWYAGLTFIALLFIFTAVIGPSIFLPTQENDAGTIADINDALDNNRDAGSYFIMGYIYSVTSPLSREFIVISLGIIYIWQYYKQASCLNSSFVATITTITPIIMYLTLFQKDTTSTLLVIICYLLLIKPDDNRQYIKICAVILAYLFYGLTFRPYFGRSLISLLSLGRSIQKAVSSHRPDIIHLHSSFAGAVGRLASIAMRSRPKIVYCAHCWSFDRKESSFTSKLWTTIELLLTNWTDLIINISPHEEKLLIDKGFPMDRVILVESGIEDIPKQSRCNSAPTESARSALSLLFVGRMDRQKGFDLLVSEFLNFDPSQFTLTVIGSKIVDRNPIPITAEINFTGWVPREKVSEYLINADILVMPSRWEGMPIAALEAFRMGIPIFASNRGPFPYIIDDGVNGIIMDIEKTGFLREALNKLKRFDLNSMKVAARATYERRFNSTRLSENLARAYENLCARDNSTTSVVEKVFS